MKKLLTIVLVFVFSLALVLAIGCSQKQPASDTGASMDQTTPPGGGEMTDSTGAMMSAPDTSMSSGGN
jgi:hypothetical protein